ncbi:tetratricopeptide repeat protein [Nostoc sp. FACHB-280]|uniref:tetratricopeptide repeat protein n=1 Tax=Nostoc sp. FACHB-280 TaxID=2692839 RepID=UPI00168B6C49|nr:tetratricopeptide repeat protein [Nostoc sp. FACHB-280]MBD2498161.1 tetratricopeptide repeat protein [Nostoc sp. FACHB-280]
MVDNYEYQVGASLPPDAPSYVVRKADSDFYHALKAGKYCYVFNSRQMGKSSLKVRVMQRLVNEGVACSSIDVSGQGSKDNVTQEQWYTGIVSKIVKDLQIAKPIEFRRTWWRDRHDISPVQKFDEFIEDVLLSSIPGQIIIFIDEIDSTLSLGFASEDFFALIRSCYNKRSENPAYKRLTFALLGVATPGDLIQDKTRTPFNIGEAIELDGFKIHEIEPLAKGLAGKVGNPQAVMQEVLAWTGGQPFLTQRVCELLGKALSIEKRDFRSVDENQIIELVKEIIHNQIIDNWEANDKQEHLKTIRDRLLINEEVSVALLGLYQQILQQKEMTADSGFEQMRLRLTGLVVQQQGKLRVYNQIYRNVFDLSWVENELDKLRFYADKLRAWVESNYQDNTCLLWGEDLEKARVWVDGRKLSDVDYRFLSASVEAELNQKVAKAEEKVTEATKKTKRQIRIGVIALTISILGAVTALIFANISNQKRVRAEDNTRFVIDKVKKQEDRAKQAENRANNAENRAEKAEYKENNTNNKLKTAVKQLTQSYQELDRRTAYVQELQQREVSLKQAERQAQGDKRELEKQISSIEEQIRNAQKELKKAQRESQLARNQVRREKGKLEILKQQVELSARDLQQARYQLITNKLKNYKESQILLQQQEIFKQSNEHVQNLLREIVKQNPQAKNVVSSFVDSLTIRGVQKQISEAEKRVLDTLIKIIKEESPGSPQEEANALLNLGLGYLRTGDYSKSLEVIQESLNIFVRIKDSDGEKIALNAIGLIYSNLGEYQKALEFYQKAISMSRYIGDIALEGIVLSNLGTVYRNLEDNQKALEYYERALFIFKRVGDRANEGTILNNMGVIYESLGDFVKALEFYQEAISISREVIDKSSEVNILNNIGRVYYNFGNLQKALKFYEQSLIITRILKNRSLEGSLLNNIANVYTSLGELKKAEKIYKESLTIGQEIADYALEATVLNNLSLIYSRLRNESYMFSYQPEYYQQRCLSVARKIQEERICHRRTAGSR